VASRRKIPYTGVGNRKNAITNPILLSLLRFCRISPASAATYSLHASRRVRDRRFVPW
jgi:hypothetical protein